MPDSPERERRPTAWARMSMERKLPLLIGVFVVAATAAIAVAGYVEVRHTSITSAEERTASVAELFGGIFTGQAEELKTLALAGARHRNIVGYATSGGSAASRAGAMTVLRALAGRNNVISAQLRSSDGRVLLTTDSVATTPPFDAMPGTQLPAEAAIGDSAFVGRFRPWGDSVVYPVAAGVPGSAEEYVVIWRRFTTTAETRELLGGLLGSNSSLFLGNVDGTLWSNLEEMVPAPAERITATESTQVYTRGPDGDRFMLRSAFIEGTPWMAAIDLPMSGVMAPVTHYVRNMSLVAAIMLLAGLVIARRATRGISEPLTRLTTAATAIARGDYSHNVRINRADELGRLGDAFGTMAEEVHESRTALETKVATRTRDLKDALHRLQDTQESLVRRERLAMLGQLASGVGHELRNPLGVMTNAVYYLRAVLAGSPDNVREYLTILEEQVTLSEKIVADLLDFARSKAPTRTPSSVDGIVQAQLARLRAPGTVSVAVHIPPDLPPVLVDATQIGQVVLNLLTNAVQAMNGAGMLSIIAHHGAGEVRIDVVDSGPGVSSENIEKVFEPLFTTKARGIGLGLALSRTFARANGGDVTLTSEPGEGAVFHLSLPTSEQEVA